MMIFGVMEVNQLVNLNQRVEVLMQTLRNVRNFIKL